MTDITKTVRAIVLLDIDGNRIAGRAYDDDIYKKQFERKLFIKTKGHRIKDEILLLEDMLAVHRFVADFHIYVIGYRNENPMILETISDCLLDVIKLLSVKTVDRSVVENHKAQLILAMDEICDNGIILETDPDLVHSRVILKDDSMEPSMARKLQSATELIRFPWIRS